MKKEILARKEREMIDINKRKEKKNQMEEEEEEERYLPRKKEKNAQGKKQK